MAITPDGMGADSWNERQNMRAARQEPRTPPWELAALDADGNILYRTEYQESQEEAERAALAINVDLENGDAGNLDPEVDHFEAVKTE